MLFSGEALNTLIERVLWTELDYATAMIIVMIWLAVRAEKWQLLFSRTSTIL